MDNLLLLEWLSQSSQDFWHTQTSLLLHCLHKKLYPCFYFKNSSYNFCCSLLSFSFTYCSTFYDFMLHNFFLLNSFLYFLFNFLMYWKLYLIKISPRLLVIGHNASLSGIGFKMKFTPFFLKTYLFTLPLYMADLSNFHVLTKIKL